MGKRSIKLAPRKKKEAEQARAKLGVTKDVLSQRLNFSRSTVQNFFASKLVSYEVFETICIQLKLDWQEFADFGENISDSINEIDQNEGRDKQEEVAGNINKGDRHLDEAFNESQDRSLILSNQTYLSQEPTTPEFIGRDREVGDIHHLTVQGAKCILIVGTGGVGKTTLARNYLEQSFNSYIEFSIAKERSNIASIASLVEEKLRSLGEETGKEFMVSLERLKCRLQRERIGVLIDNLEPALDGNGQFVDEHRGYIELLRVLTDSSLRSTTLITSREPLNEALDIKILMLGGLKDKVWHSFFSQQGINADISIVTEVHRAFGGNALAMKILCTPIKTYHDGDLVAYWQECKTESGLVVEQALENLVREQFNRLQNNCSEAYKLLCRMGCFRYQDVSTVPQEGLFSLLGDVTKEQHRRLIRSLRDRALIEVDKGEYFLHPVIRIESISRLKASNEWETANCEAAKFWADNVISIETVEDGLRAFEAYHHYITINECKLAAKELTKRRPNEWSDDGEPLGDSLYRVGLLDSVKQAIEVVIKHIPREYDLSRLYNILGDVHWLMGNSREAIKYHEVSKDVAIEINNYILEAVAFFNIGLCLIDLWEIQFAIENFEECIRLTETINRGYTVDSYFCLSFLYSVIGCEEKSIYYADQVFQELKLSCGTAWSAGYRWLFLGKAYTNLLDLEQASRVYADAIEYSKQNYYPQVEANTLNGLAVILRIQKNLDNAIALHKQAIEILDNIGAKCDCAEAYFQLGLTYQAMGEQDQAEEYKAKAIEIFAQMQASEQIIRVDQAFGGNIQ